MTDQVGIEDEVRAGLHRVAGAVDVPRIEVGTLETRGQIAARRRYRWRATAILASAAAVAVVVAGITITVRGDSDTGMVPQPPRVATQPAGPTTTSLRSVQSSPSPGHPSAVHPPRHALPQGAPVTAPHWGKGVLYWGQGYSAKVSYPSLATGAGVTLVTTRGNHGRLVIRRIDGPRLVRLTNNAAGWPVVSGDGRYAAWETALKGRRQKLILWDLRSGSVVLSREFTSHAQCCDAPSIVLGFDSERRVYVEDGHVKLMWDTRQQTLRRIDSNRVVVRGVWAHGPVVAGQVSGLSGPGSLYGTVDARGRFHKTGEYPSQTGVWSDDGLHVAYTYQSKRDFKGLYVKDTRTGKARRIHLPKSWTGEPVFWDSTNTFLVKAGDGHGHGGLLRCNAVSGLCTKPTPQPQHVAILPHQQGH